MSDIAAAVDRARALLEVRRLDEALAVLLEAHRAHPEDPDLPIEIANVHLERGDFAEARRWAPLTEALVGLAEVEARAGRWSEARRLFEQALAEDADDPEARMGLARTMGATGDAAGAEAEFRAVAENAHTAAAFLALAGVIETQGRRDEARGVLEVASSMHPHDDGILVALARLTPPEARGPLLDRAIEVNHHSFGAWFEVLKLRCAEKDPEGGAEAFAKCLALDPAEMRKRWEAETADPRSPLFEYAEHPYFAM